MKFKKKSVQFWVGGNDPFYTKYVYPTYNVYRTNLTPSLNTHCYQHNDGVQAPLYTRCPPSKNRYDQLDTDSMPSHFNPVCMGSPTCQLIFSRKSDCLGCAVLLCLVCLFDLACFFLSSFSSLIKNMYMYMVH